MSVHAAKGLEFKSVFVVGLEEKLFPSFMASDSPEGLDEERRLFYVAVTRAEQLLTLSYANSRYRFGQMRFNEPSRFLEEVPRQHAESTAHFRGSQGMAEDSAAEIASGAKISGNFVRRGATVSRLSTVDAANFKASPSETIQKGMRVLHLKFGEGEVLDIEGGKDNRIATIFFKAAEDDPKKRIMLKFAKLQIVS
jgi:DNA helicase-2/ATP-dependent DNA helicase PcrA